MTITRRQWLAHVLSACALGACATTTDGPYARRSGRNFGRGINVIGGPIDLPKRPEWSFLPWNDPSNLARWEPNPRRTGRNAWKDGLALSAGGRHIAVPVATSPLNAITIVDVETSERWRIAHPNPLIQLTQPTFSPDGEHVACLASPPTYNGHCEIWIAPIRGGEAIVIRSSEPRTMYWPAFSWDGKKIACFRDVSPGPETPPPPDKTVQPEYGVYKYCQAFEYDLETGRESALNDLVLKASNARTAYTPDNAGLLIGLQGLAEFGVHRIGRRGRVSRFHWGDAWDFIQPEPGQLDGRRLFEMRPGQTIEQFPPSARPDVLGLHGVFDEYATFYGADRFGNVVISHLQEAHRCAPSGEVLDTLALADSRLGARYDNFGFCAIASDGAAIAGATPWGQYGYSTRVDVRRDGAIRTFELDPLDDGPHNTRVITAGPGQSAFAD